MYKLIILLFVPLVCFSQISYSKTLDIWNDTFKKNIELENVILIDVRTFEEYSDGHIKGAVNVDYYKENFFNSYFENIDKNKIFYIYCKSGSYK